MSDIARLFSTDPLKLSKEDFEQVIAHMRSKRGQFNLGNLKAGNLKPPTPAQAAKAEKLKGLDLGGIDL